jgi:hypothetical protein
MQLVAGVLASEAVFRTDEQAAVLSQHILYDTFKAVTET